MPYVHFDDITYPVDIGGEVEWKLRHNQENLTSQDIMFAASVMFAYRYLLSTTKKQRDNIVSNVLDKTKELLNTQT
jgi:hypothetical protein